MAPSRRAERDIPTPPEAVPPDFDAEAEALLGDKKALYSLLKHNLLVAYLREVEAGNDTTANPQHSRASRKAQKDYAELLVRVISEEAK